MRPIDEADEDLNAITDWLLSDDFTVNVVYPSGTVIDIFSGTAAQVRKAFHTEIHNLDVHGKKHVANMSDPDIPGRARTGGRRYRLTELLSPPPDEPPPRQLHV